MALHPADLLAGRLLIKQYSLAALGNMSAIEFESFVVRQLFPIPAHNAGVNNLTMEMEPLTRQLMYQ